MTAASSWPFEGCQANVDYGNTQDSTGNTIAQRANNQINLDNHPENKFSWLTNSIAYSGRSVAHIFYLSILFTLAALSRAVFKRTSMLHGGKLTSTSHVLILIIVGALLAVIVSLVRNSSTPDCLRGAWKLTDDDDGSDISYLYFGILPLLIFKPSFDLDYNWILRNIETIVIMGGGSFIAVVTVVTAFIVTTIQPFGEIALDSTRFPNYGEFRSFAMGGMLAVIITVADTSLILGLLREIGGKNNRLSAIIENGGWIATCLGTTLFEIFRISVQSSATWRHGTWIAAVSWKMIVSPIFGYLMCRINGKLLSIIINDTLAECLMIYASFYWTFSFGNLLGLSGPIAIMAYNIFFDHSNISREAELTVKRFYDVITFFCAIYLSGSVGFVWVEQLWDHILASESNVSVWKDIVWIVVLYVFVTAARLIIMQLVSYFVNNETIRWKESVLISWGEVRGPVNMILALIVLHDPELSWVQHCPTGHTDAARMFSKFDGRSIGSCEGDISNISVAINGPVSWETKEFTLSKLYAIAQQKIFFYGIGVLILNQIINTLSLDSVTGKLGIYQISSGQKSTMSTAILKIKSDVSKSCLTMRYDPFLTDADWELVNAKSLLAYPYKAKQSDKQLRESKRISTDQHSNDTQLTAARDMEEARQRVLNALKTSFSKQRNDGLISDDAVTVLNQAVNSVQNENQSTQFVSLNQLKRNWKLFGFLPKLASIIDQYLYNSNERKIRNTWRRHWLRKAHRLALSSIYEVFMQLVILVNMILMLVEYILSQQAKASQDYSQGFLEADILDGVTSSEMNDNLELLQKQTEHCKTENICLVNILYWIDVLFLFIYVFDVIFKALILSWKEYWISAWNKFDVFIVILSCAEAIASLVIGQYVNDEINNMEGNTTSSLKILKLFKVIKMVKVLRAVRTMRMARLLRFSRTIVPYVMKWINEKINQRMSFGYDVGRGFIKGIEELESSLDMIAGDNIQIKRKLRRIAEKSRTIVIRDLGLLQKNYPGIATSVKTKTAIRNLINVMFESVQRLQSGGILDDFEVHVIFDQINILVKDLTNIPVVMKTVPTENLFLNITWVNGDRELANFLLQNSVLCDFDLGDVVVQDDEEPDSIFLVLTGLVKIVSGEYRGEENESSMSMDELTEGDDEDDDDSHIHCDYASTGAVVGELGCLIGESAGLSVICETSVSTYQIPVETIRLAFEKFPKLKDSLWKVVGLKLAVPLLQKDFKWQGFTGDEIRIHLQSGRVYTFERGDEFKLDASIADCILIDGTAIHKDEELEAPAIVHHIEREEMGSNEVQESMLLIPQRAVLLVVKKRKGAVEINATESRLSRNSVRITNGYTSRTSLNAVVMDKARQKYIEKGPDAILEATEELFGDDV